MDVDIDTGERGEGAVDVDVSTTADSDTDASGIDETGTLPMTGGGFDTDTGALPETDRPDNTRLTCGEVRDINREHYVLSLGRRFGTLHYVVTPATTFSPSDFSFEWIGPGSRVMISYVTLHGMRIAVHITVHE
jgi:hypothetical protein